MQQKIDGLLVPKLRFPEFWDAGEWEEKTIGNICKTFSGGTPSTSQKEFYGGDIPFIRSAEIDKDRTELFLTKEGLTNSAAKLIEKGDVLVALYGANSGDVALAKTNGAINQAILCLKSDNSNAFIYQYLSLKKDWVVSTYIQGGQGNLSGEIVKSITLSFPSPLEQQKIADCLFSISDRITAETQKLDTLKAHKKGLMRQLFPAEGETLPKLRFPEFRDAGEWVLKEFSKYIVLCRGSSPRPIQSYLTSDSRGVNWIKIGDTKFAKNFIISQVEERITSKGAEKSRRVNIGELILANSMSYGKTYQVAIDGCIYDGWFVLREYEKYFDKQFLLQLLNSEYMQNQYERFSAGGIVQNISSDIVYKTVLPHASLKEQKKIADCLASLDALITAQTQKIGTLKTHKKGLMQQLFPAADEVTA